jgi:hypothetical protein
MNRVLNQMPPAVRAEAEAMLKEIQHIPLDTDKQKVDAVEQAVHEYNHACERLTALGIATELPEVSQVSSIAKSLMYLFVQGDGNTISSVGETVYQAVLYYRSMEGRSK